jgi:hypothetical protein
MSDEAKLREARTVGEKAVRLLENEFFKELIAMQNKKAHDKFAASKGGAEGDDERRQAHIRLQILRDMLSDLKRLGQVGNQAKRELE